jgi:5-methylcytosine-specific restriction endonuclease McrA
MTGRGLSSGRLGAEHGLVLDMALTEARDALFQQVKGGTDTGQFPDLVEALREIADRSLDSVTEPSRRDRFRIYLHLDAQSSTCTDAHGIRVPDALSGLARCEADLRAVIERDGIAVNIGRSSRVIPSHTRRMVIHRDQGCRVPGCTSQQHLHVHHVVEWSRGGATDTHNLLSLCPHHHRRVHDGHLRIQAPPGSSGPVNADSPHGIRFLDARGKVIGYRALSPPVPMTAIPAQRFVHPTGESYDAWSVSFTPPRSDPAVCVRDQN